MHVDAEQEAGVLAMALEPETACAARIALLTRGDTAELTRRLQACGLASGLHVLSGLEAVSGNHATPDLILLDMDSHCGDGADAIRRLRRLSPVIVLIGPVGEEAAIDYIHAGACDCVRKDRLERLGPAVRNALRKRIAPGPEQAATGPCRTPAQILEDIAEGFFAVDRQWRFTCVNRSAEQILGRKREDLLGNVLWQEFPDFSESAIAGQLMKAALSGAPAEFEAHLGSWKVWAEFHVHPSEQGLSVYFQDVTSRKHLEEQLRQSQRMEAMGLLTGGVAHDFNNLLTIIGGYGQMTLDGLGSGHPLRLDAEAIIEAAERASLLTRQLLAFSRRQIVQPHVLDLNRLVSKMHRMARRLIGEDIELTIRLAEHLGRIKADPAQIEQVIMNLLVNARDAMPMGGRLTIATAEADPARGAAALPHGSPSGRWVMLAISDTGSGIAPEVKERIFEPFFTTKGKGQGTGLGLSTVCGIVKQSGGEIEVETEVGHGSTFRIFLPRVEAHCAPRSAEPPAGKTRKGSETILLAEDEPTLKKMVRHMLVRQGYRVIACGSASDAIRMLQRRRRPVDLLLTDVIMPRMGGRELAERLRAFQPGLKVLFMSGYTGDVIARHGVLEGNDLEFLPKPFTAETLACRVRAVLDARKLLAAAAAH